MVGGRDFATQQYNVAVQGHRQTGSAFKPFVLVTALASGVSPEQTFASGSMKLKIPGGQTWSVTGAHGGRRSDAAAPRHLGVGQLRVRAARAQGRRRTRSSRPRRPWGSRRRSLRCRPSRSAACGEGVTPLEMTNAYGTLANGGTRMRPYGVLEVKDKDGTVLDPRQALRRSARSTAAVAYLTTDILKGVITNGTGTKADIGRPAAGKTGTTQEYRDAWFCGYTPDLVASVWVGYPECTARDDQRARDQGDGRVVPRPDLGLVHARGAVRHAQDDFQASRGPDAGAHLPGLGRQGHRILPADRQRAVPRRASSRETARSTPRPSRTAMPNLIGMPKADAIAALGKLQLKATIVEKSVDGVAAGIVARRRTRRPGSAVTTGTIVTLTVSNGRRDGGQQAADGGVRLDAQEADSRRRGQVRRRSDARTTGPITKWVWEFGDGGEGHHVRQARDARLRGVRGPST